MPFMRMTPEQEDAYCRQFGAGKYAGQGVDAPDSARTYPPGTLAAG